MINHIATCLRLVAFFPSIAHQSTRILYSLGASPKAWFYDFYVAGAVKDDVKFDLNKLSKGVFLFWDGERVGWLGRSFQQGKKTQTSMFHKDQ